MSQIGKKICIYIYENIFADNRQCLNQVKYDNKNLMR